MYARMYGLVSWHAEIGFFLGWNLSGRCCASAMGWKGGREGFLPGMVVLCCVFGSREADQGKLQGMGVGFLGELG